MIEINKLTVKYKTPAAEVTALEQLDLNLARGEICALIGPSGCGKSTLLHVLSGITRSYTGEVLIHGEPVNAKVHRIGLVPQDFGLLEWETVYANAVMGLRLKKEPIRKQEESIRRILQRLGIYALKDRFPSQISGGQRQRVSLARSFILRPDVLLMDEPFSALDAITREETQDLFLDVWKSHRVTTLFVTHSIEEALYVGEKIAIFSPAPGRVVKIIKNPLFGTEGLRFKKDFYDRTMDLRKTVEEEWAK